MSPNKGFTALEQLDGVIEQTVAHISDFTKHPGDFTRNRRLNAFTTIKVTLDMEGQSLNTEMIHAFPKMEDRMTSSAYEQQKAKLTPELFLHLLREFNKTPHKHNLYNDKYQLYAIDGSDFSIPYQSKSKYVVPNPNGITTTTGENKPICQMHGNLLFNISDRTYEDIVIQSKLQFDERSAAIDMLDKLETKYPYIVLMDRGYDGFNMIEHGNRLRGDGYYVIRTKCGAGGIKEISDLPDKECDVEMEFKVTTSGQYYLQNKDKEPIHLIRYANKRHKKYYSPNTKQQRWDFNQFEKIKCRVVKFRINNPDTGRDEWEILVTNLNRFEFPIEKMKELYHIRWDIETSFRELKYALGAVQFHSRKDDFVEMELLAHLIMFNAVSRCINVVTVPQSSKRKHKYVVSFKDATTLVRKAYRVYSTQSPIVVQTELLSFTRPLISGKADKRNLKSKPAVWFVYRVA